MGEEWKALTDWSNWICEIKSSKATHEVIRKVYYDRLLLDLISDVQMLAQGSKRNLTQWKKSL